MSAPHLQLFHYFKSLTQMEEEEFQLIQNFFTVCKFKKGEYLLRQGETCGFHLFVCKGALRLFHTNEQGQEFTRYFAFEEKFGTALSSLIEQKPAAESIQAILPSTVLKISKTQFFELVEHNPKVNWVYRNMLENAYITSQKRIYDLQGVSAIDRLKWLKGQYPDILLKIPSKLIASYLGITSYTLSRIKSEL